MIPLQQLKQTKAPIKLDGSATDLLYDHCPDFHFVFDVFVETTRKRWSGTKYAPTTWSVKHHIRLTALKVTETVNYTDVELSESELDEIAKEIINKIEIE